jgi:hypothetical protein
MQPEDWICLPHKKMPVYANNKVKPRLERELRVLVAEDLEAECVIAGSIARLRRGLGVQTADKSIESPEHTGLCGIDSGEAK